MKDPALLWYFNDWMGGTATMSRHLKGCYMDLLCVQFNSGALSLEEIKTVLGSDFGSWPALQKKFKCENGLYFNERLLNEKDKRSSFTLSRRNNAKHMHKHMEDINININTLPDWLNIKAWEAWLKYNLEKKKKLPPSTIAFQLRKLEKNIKDHPDMIRQSIESGWTGLFPIKKEPENRAHQSSKRFSESERESEIRSSDEENENRKKLRKQVEILSTNMSVQ